MKLKTKTSNLTVRWASPFRGQGGAGRKIQLSIFAFALIFALPLLLTTCEKPERNNPWDRGADPASWSPTELTVSPNFPNSVTLNWKDNSFGEEGFKIDRRMNEEEWQQGYTTLSANQTSYTDNAVNMGYKYTYRVYAFAGNFTSTFIERFVSSLDGNTGLVTFQGYTYKTVYIGGMEWFAENLRTTNYNDGNSIPHVTAQQAWYNLSTPAYCWYNNDQTTYGNTYGALYNWYTVNTGKLCPTGWHVPSDAEWAALIDYVGGASIAGTKLKATSDWNSGGNGTDEYGFSALPGGYCNNYGGGYFLDMSYGGYWWSSTEKDASYSWNWFMRYLDGNVSRYFYSKGKGYSVRCIRD